MWAENMERRNSSVDTEKFIVYTKVWVVNLMIPQGEVCVNAIAEKSKN
jgi:hypothetical protein